jgi:mannose-6-phosphate isomerase-like protein (cupin superfamily)
LASFFQKEGNHVKLLPVALLAAAFLTAATPAGVDVYTSKDLNKMRGELAQKGGQFASEPLQKYDKHYTMLAYRNATGSSELHEHEADVFFIQSGGATLLLGGKIVNGKTEKEGEIRGTSIQGGERRVLAAGDVVHIPAGTPHQMLVEKGTTVTYFVVKVTGQ